VSPLLLSFDRGDAIVPQVLTAAHLHRHDWSLTVSQGEASHSRYVRQSRPKDKATFAS